MRGERRVSLTKIPVHAGLLEGVSPSRHGMVEALICARAAAFAGTLYSTFSGYIHRLRGYHSGERNVMK